MRFAAKKRRGRKGSPSGCVGQQVWGDLEQRRLSEPPQAFVMFHRLHNRKRCRPSARSKVAKAGDCVEANRWRGIVERLDQCWDYYLRFDAQASQRGSGTFSVAVVGVLQFFEEKWDGEPRVCSEFGQREKRVKGDSIVLVSEGVHERRGRRSAYGTEGETGGECDEVVCAGKHRCEHRYGRCSGGPENYESLSCLGRADWVIGNDPLGKVRERVGPYSSHRGSSSQFLGATLLGALVNCEPVTECLSLVPGFTLTPHQVRGDACQDGEERESWFPVEIGPHAGILT